MTNLLKSLMKKRRVSSILGLALDGNRLEAVVVRRLNGSLQVQRALNAPLNLSPLTGDPELAGQEIRNLLDAAGIRERRCAVCLPLSWILTMQTKVPELPEADIASFLQLEAERGFHSGPENLFIAESRALASGEHHATLMAVPRNHLAAFEGVLKAAQLKPLSFSLGVAALQAADQDKDEGVLTLALGSNSFDLLVTAGGGIAALRSLDGVVEGEGPQKRIDDDLVAREIRITLGQLPGAFSDRIKKARLCGRGELARQFVNDLSPRLEAMGMKVQVMEIASPAHFDKPPPAEIILSPGLALAANHLKGVTAVPELLPPKVQPWQRFLTSSKFSSKKLAWAGAGAGVLLLGVGCAFGVQQWQISRLESQWNAMEPKVTALKATQQQIRKFRPWFDSSYKCLRILKTLTEAFPEEGSVWLKSLEIRDLATVTCTGSAQNAEAFAALRARLGKIDKITKVSVDSLRGQNPMQFTIILEWEGGKSGGN
jgi:hypothetical protein